ncbi:MAG TPA: hypothetical protein VIX89_00535 [Bryobacteraceae bacterium]
MKEFSDRRVLTGFRCVDAITQRPVVEPLPIASPLLQVRQNHSGVYAVLDGPGLTPLTTQFRPVTPWPVATNYEIGIRDPRYRYLPRRARIQAPQLTVSGAPQEVVLYPGPAAPVDPNWAVLHVSVVNAAAPHDELPWPVLRVFDTTTVPPAVRATGAGDDRGQALLAIPGLGLQVSSTADGKVTETTTAATVQAWFDPGVLDQPKGWIPDPDDMLQRRSSLKTATETIQIGPGLRFFVTISIST